MKIVIFMIEGPYSNNKENTNFAPSSLGRPWQKIFFINFIDQYENINFMFEGPI